MSDSERLHYIQERLRLLRERRQMIEENLESIEESFRKTRLDAWTDPGPHNDRAVDALQEQLEGLQKQNEAAERDEQEIFNEIDVLRKTSEEKKSSIEEQLRSFIEDQYDLHKHITTLSTAAILSIAALTRLFPSSSNFESATAISLVCFLVAIGFALFAMSWNVGERLGVAVDKEQIIAERGAGFRLITKVWSIFGYVFSFGSQIAFISGLIVIVLFVLSHS